MENNVWQMYAVRYASHERRSHENFLGTDPHENAPMPMDYFVWALVCDDRTILVDTGYDAPMAAKRGRQYFKSPDIGLHEIGIDAATVKVQATDKTYGFKPLGDVRPVVDAGGLFNYARKTGMMPA